MQKLYQNTLKINLDEKLIAKKKKKIFDFLFQSLEMHTYCVFLCTTFEKSQVVKIIMAAMAMETSHSIVFDIIVHNKVSGKVTKSGGRKKIAILFNILFLYNLY